MPLGREVDLGPGNIVLDGHPAPPKGRIQNFRPMSGWIKMPLSTEVCLDPGDIVLDEHPAPQKGAQQPYPLFGQCPL